MTTTNLPKPTLPTPQLVTSRYAMNLIRNGKNDTFSLAALEQQEAKHDGVVVGHFYVAAVRRTAANGIEQATGVTPYQAVQRALAKHGVTFK